MSGLAVCTALALGGCSSSSGSASAPTSGSAASQSTPTLPAIFGSGGPLDVSKLCAAVPQADIQKLFKAPAPAVVADPGECDWGSGGITVNIFFNDGDKKLYSGGAVSSATATDLSGVGDLAQWEQPVPGQTPPFLVAHKGTTSISVSPGLDVNQTTMSYTGSAPFFKVSNAAAEQYAAEEGQICNDIFAAAKS